MRREEVGGEEEEEEEERKHSHSSNPALNLNIPTSNTAVVVYLSYCLASCIMHRGWIA